MGNFMMSVIMSSYNRPHLLEYGLWSLREYPCSIPYEIIVVNDGPRDGTMEVCNKYGAKYIESRTSNFVSRCPGIALNIGVNEAKGDTITLTCPEVFQMRNSLQCHAFEIYNTEMVNHKKKLVIPRFVYFDLNNEYLDVLSKDRKALHDRDLIAGDRQYECATMPFFMTMYKDTFTEIGGYDEDFTGYASDDNDLVSRLLDNGCFYHRIHSKCVHLWHGSHNNCLSHTDNAEWVYNQKLFNERKGLIKRNSGKVWK